MPSYAIWARASAGIGLVAWLILFGVLSLGGGTPEIIERLLLFAVLVVVPLVLLLAATPDRHGRHSAVYRSAVLFQPLAAASVVASLAVAPGPTAALLAAPWALLTVLIALFGLTRLLPRGVAVAEEVAVDVGLIYLVVGGAWLVVFRLGAHPLAFGDTITLLTAVHFHYAGFAAPIIAGMTGRALTSRSSSRAIYRWVVGGIVVGPLLVALGITFSRVVEGIAVLVLAFSLMGLSGLTIGVVVPSLQRSAARWLLAVSAGSILVGMLFALGYALSWSTGLLPIDIPLMARVHGVVNGLGFAFCGMTGWILIRPSSRLPAPGIPFSRLASVGKVGPDFFQRSGAVPTVECPPRGLIDDLGEFRRADFDPARIDPKIRDFYERTAEHELLVAAEWAAGFRLGSRIFKRLSARIGQMNFPVAASEQREDLIESQILPIDDAADGRSRVRAWIRTYVKTGAAVYVAAYATHRLGKQTYMNIAFPLPGGNLTSILRLDELPDSTVGRRESGSLGEICAANLSQTATFPMSAASSGFTLTTRPGAAGPGDEGVYLANRVLPIRLPLNETIRVWPLGDRRGQPREEPVGPPAATIAARHDVWLYGIRFLTLRYWIWRKRASGHSASATATPDTRP